MVMHVRSQRAHRCITLAYHQATRSDQLATIVELILTHRGHIVDRAPCSLDRPRCMGKHAISQGFTAGAGPGLVHTSRLLLMEVRQKLPQVLSYHPPDP